MAGILGIPIRRPWPRPAGRRADRPARRRAPAPRPEALEDRLAPAIYTVLTTGDGQGPVTRIGQGAYTAPTLRAAINAANTVPGPDVIQFAPALAGATIRVGADDSLLPTALGQTAFVIRGNLTIVGDRAQPQTIQNVGPRRLFGVVAQQALALSDLTLSGGVAAGGDGGDYSLGGGGGGGGAWAAPFTTWARWS